MAARVDGGAGGAASAARLGERLADIGSARVLRLWRTLPGMERAAAIDEQWHAATEAFGRHVGELSGQAGWPSPEESQRASAWLLLCAVHPEHERQLERRLATARRTAARHKTWWAQLSAEGQRNPPAAVLALLTSDRARSEAVDERAAARAADRAQRDARRESDKVARVERERIERARRDAEAVRPEPPPDPRAAVVQPYRPRFVPVRRALSSATSAWSLALLLAGLVGYLWAADTLGDRLVAHREAEQAAGVGSSSAVDAARDALAATGWAVLLLLLLPAMYVATKALLGKGASRLWVRAYAGGAAAVDLLVGFTFLPAATLAVLVLQVGADTSLDTTVAPPFAGESWGSVALLLPYGLLGIWLIVRSLWRLARAVLGRPVAGPFLGPGTPAWR